MPALALPWAVLLSLHVPRLLPRSLPQAQLPEETQLSPRLCYCRCEGQNPIITVPVPLWPRSLPGSPSQAQARVPASQDVPWLIMSHSLEPCSSLSCLWGSQQQGGISHPSFPVG